MATYALGSKEGRFVMASTILASAMAFIDGTALNVILPSLQKSLNATGTDLFWILNAYLLMLASLILIGGSLGDKLGRKKIFTIGILIFLVGSLLCGFAADVLTMIIYRAIQGIGGALMIPGSLSLISSSINPDERGKAIGTWSAITTIVTMGGPVLGGFFGDAGLWRYIFFINIPIGLVAIFLLLTKVKETKNDDDDKSIDYAGAITIVAALSSLTFGFLEIPEVGLYNWKAYFFIISGTFLLLIFIMIEYKSKHPMMPLKLFSKKTFSGANLLTFFLYAGLGAGMLFLSLNMVQAQGYSQLQSGLTFLPFTILMILMARFSGALADKHGPRLLLIVGPAVAGLGFILLSLVKETNGFADYWTTFFPGIMVFGFGMSLTVVPLTTAVMAAVDDHFSGTASGINNALTRISNVFANAVFGALAVVFFTGALQKNIASVSLNPHVKQEVIKESVNLGNAKVPDAVLASDKEMIKKAYRDSFIKVYTNIMLISAALCFTGAFMAFALIKNIKPVKNSP